MSEAITLEDILQKKDSLRNYELMIMTSLFTKSDKEKIYQILYAALKADDISFKIFKSVFDRYQFTNSELHKLFGAIDKNKINYYISAIGLIIGQLSRSVENNIIFKYLFSDYIKKFDDKILNCINNGQSKFVFDNDLENYIIGYFNGLNTLYNDDKNIISVKKKLIELLYNNLHIDVYITSVLPNKNLQIDSNVFKEYHIESGTMNGKIEKHFNCDHPVQITNDGEVKSIEIAINEPSNNKSVTSLQDIFYYILNNEEYRENLFAHIDAMNTFVPLLEKVKNKLSVLHCVKLVTKLTKSTEVEIIKIIIDHDNETYDTLKTYLTNS